MPEPTSVNRPQIKSELASLDKPQLIALLKGLLDHCIESRAFLSARFLAEGVPDAILAKYRKRIVEQFLPERGEGKLDLRAARGSLKSHFPFLSCHPLNRAPICPTCNSPQNQVALRRIDQHCKRTKRPMSKNEPGDKLREWADSAECEIGLKGFGLVSTRYCR